MPQKANEQKDDGSVKAINMPEAKDQQYDKSFLSPGMTRKNTTLPEGKAVVTPAQQGSKDEKPANDSSKK